MKKLTLSKTIKAVLERGYTLDEEYDFLNEKLTPMQFWTENRDEHFWGIKLDDNHFLICNSVLEFLGSPRSVIGLVGYCKGNVMLRKETIECFKKAGKEAIDYFHRKTK